MAAFVSFASRTLVTSYTVLHERLWTGKAPTRLCVPAASIMLPTLWRPWYPRIANMHSCRAQAAQRNRWFSATGAGGVKGLPVEGKNARGKKDKGGGVTVTAAEGLRKLLLKHITQEKINRKRLLELPPGWTRINIDEYVVNRGDEDIIVVRKAFPDYIVDVVACTQLFEPMDETPDFVTEDYMPPGDSAVVLVAITKLGRGKPLVIETVANSETGFGYRRVSVGIDQNAYLASGSNGAGQVYGPATALYVTYSAMWQDQLKSPNLRSGEMDSEEVKLWLAAQKDCEADPSFAVSPDISELHPKLQIPIYEMVEGIRNHELELEDDILAFVFALLHHVRSEGHHTFLDTCSAWLKK